MFLVASRAGERAMNAIKEAERTDELTTYLTQREKWIEQTAPRTAALMRSWADDIATETWRCIGSDYKREVWKYLDQEQRGRLRRLCAS
jgi:hypothetical protein